MNQPPKGKSTSPTISPIYGQLQAGESALSREDYRKLSKEFRRNLLDYYGAGKSSKSSLAHLLCLETYDMDRVRAQIDLVKWSMHLGCRPRDLERNAWRELIKDLIVDFNPAQGSYQLRPDINLWWRSGLSGREEEDLRAGQELPLGAERPLSDAQSDMARQAVLKRTDAQPPGDQPGCPTPAGPQEPKESWTADWDKLKSELGCSESNLGGKKEGLEGAAISPRVKRDDIAGGATISPRGAEIPQKPPDTPVAKARRYRRALYACNALKEDHAFKARQSRGGGPAPPGAEGKKIAEAWAFLRQIDTVGSLAIKKNEGRWAELCRRDPDYVLSLRGALEAGEKKAQREGKRITSPMRYIAKKVWDEGMFPR